MDNATALLIKHVKELFRLQDRLRYATDKSSPQLLAERQKLINSISHERKAVKDQIQAMENLQAYLFK